MKKISLNPIIAGVIIGLSIFALQAFGNPVNNGVSITSFLLDFANSVRFLDGADSGYMRPEIVCLFYGAFMCSLVRRQFQSRGGSSPLTRFTIAFLATIGCAVFGGSPLSIFSSLAGGDLNAICGLLGFMGGTTIGCIFLYKGFNLGRCYKQKLGEGLLPTFAMIGLLILNAHRTGIFGASTRGMASVHASIYVSVTVAYLIGCIVQVFRYDPGRGMTEVLLYRDWSSIFGGLALFLTILLLNLITGVFKFGFVNQPYSHSLSLWNFIGMFIVGLGSSFLGGTPLKQIVLAGEGNSDSAISVLGCLVGLSFSNRLGLRAAGSVPSRAGKIITLIALGLLLIIGFCGVVKIKKRGSNG